MTTSSDNTSNSASGESALDRAAAAGPLHDIDDSGSGSANLEPAEARDSPAAIDEEIAAGEAQPGLPTDLPPGMHSVYGEPESLRRERSGD